jgi:hypothetical protein
MSEILTERKKTALQKKEETPLATVAQVAPLSFFKKFLKIQIKLKAPKGQLNQFGNYRYRSCEDILEAAKPLLAEQGLVITLSDEIIHIGERYYVRATAKISDGEKEILVSALAREEENKKGMDGAQITGAASSYARKYALNGLFAIDDTKDADTKDNSVEEPTKLLSEKQKETIYDLYSALEITPENWQKALKAYSVDSVEKFTEEKATDLISKLQKKLEAKNLNQ